MGWPRPQNRLTPAALGGRTRARKDFTVRVGIGKWIEHIATAAIETVLVSMLFLPVDVAETAWNVEIEANLIKDMKTFVG